MPCGIGEAVFHHDIVCTEATGHQHDQDKQAVGDNRLVGCLVFYCREVQEPDREVRSQGDEHTVDKEQVQRSTGVLPVPVGYAVPYGAQWWHKCRSNGHAGHDRAFVLTREFEYTGYAAKERNQHIVDRRVGTCQQFGRIIRLQRCYQEVQRGRQQTDGEHYSQVLERLDEQVGVVCAESHSEPDNRAHEWRYKHRTNNHRYGVHVQSDRGNHDSHEQDIYIRSAERDIAADVGRCRLCIDIIREAELPAQESHDSLLEFVVFHLLISQYLYF